MSAANAPGPDWSLPVAPLALTLGDAAGIGVQITLDAWQSLRETGPAFMLIAPPEIVDALTRERSVPEPIEQVASAAIARHTFARALPVLPMAQRPARPVVPGVPDAGNAHLAVESIRQAVALTRAGETSGVVTNPIAKSVLAQAGFAHPGHTEFLAELVTAPGERAPEPVMMLVGGGLRVALATIHVPLMQVAGLLSVDGLMRTARTVESALRRDFGLERPRLAFTGLNPHAGEAGRIGQEEIAIINPAASVLRAQGVDISDARPADTVFAEALGGAFDAVIAMTHDQGLIPVKTLDLWGGVNVTLGLPIVRTSPDHGTAFDVARSRSGRPDSLISAIRLAGELVRARQRSRVGT